MIKYLSLLLFGLVSAQAATGVRTSEYPKTNALPPGGLINIAMPGNTNVAIYGSNLLAGASFSNAPGVSNYIVQIITNSIVQIITNVVGSVQAGSTNILQLSVQAAKLPATNYPGIDAGWQDWELLYYKTNAEGSISILNASWQFIVPQDYATNSLKVRVYSFLSTTNGPNASNTIFRASVLRATPSDSTDLHIGSFGSAARGTNTWSASGAGTNKVQSLVIATGTNSLLSAGDLCILKLDRDATTDTFGGVTAVIGLQLEYTRQ